jgi:hypothetical protein
MAQVVGLEFKPQYCKKKKKISWFCNYTVVLKFVIIKRSRVKEIHKLSVLFPNF